MKTIEEENYPVLSVLEALSISDILQKCKASALNSDALVKINRFKRRVSEIAMQSYQERVAMLANDFGITTSEELKSSHDKDKIKAAMDAMYVLKHECKELDLIKSIVSVDELRLFISKDESTDTIDVFDLLAYKLGMLKENG